ncbi:MAG TPA: methionyl-tRNA formyltransferase [Acidobacteriota bacterium]|nr:methionyl-tRNA formyltransferase [Acidobacteriota bacterium]
MKIIYMGSPEFAVPSLQEIARSEHEIVVVVTQPDRPSGRSLRVQPPAVKVAAQQLGLPILQPETTKSTEFVAQLAAYKPDLLVVVAYGEILRTNLLELSPAGSVNLHASLLPRYRGAAPIAWAILKGERETGVTTMRIVKEMDAGPVFLQQQCPIDPDDTTATLSTKLARIGAPLLVQTIDRIEAGTITPAPQDETMVSLAPKLKKEDGLIDWKRESATIARMTRAFDPWPGAFTHFQGKLLKILQAIPAQIQAAADAPGTCFRITRTSMLIACGEGSSLEIVRVQPENRAAMSAADFARGHDITPGSKLG